MKYLTTNRRRQIVFAVLTAFAFLFAAQIQAAAQNEFKGYQVGRYEGDIVNTTYNVKGTAAFEIRKIDRITGEVTAFLTPTSSNLSGEGVLTGKIDENGVLRVSGPIAGATASVVARVSGDTINANYRLSGSSVQNGTFTARLTTAIGETDDIPVPDAPAPKQTASDNSTKKAGSQTIQTPANKGKWKVGDKLEVESRAVWYPAQITAVDGSRYKIHYDGYSEGSDEWVAEARMRSTGGTKDTEANAAAECSFEPPAPKHSNSDPFSADLAKRELYDGYNLYANGTLSAPRRVGVQFLSFQLGGSYKNIVKNVPGVGAKRINDAAPPNMTIYRVKSKHIVCEEYSDGVSRKQVTSDYDCFKNRDGEWVCGSSGDVPPVIIQLK